MNEKQSIFRLEMVILSHEVINSNVQQLCVNFIARGNLVWVGAHQYLTGQISILVALHQRAASEYCGQSPAQYQEEKDLHHSSNGTWS